MLENVNRVLVSNTEAANTGTTRQTIVNGDILIFNRTNTTALTGTPTPISAEGNDVIYVAQGIGNGKGLDSFRIALRNVTNVRIGTYAAPSDKVITFGYNGTSGTILAPNNNTEYALNINILDDQRVLGNRPTRQYFSFKTDSSATPKELIVALTSKVNRDASNSLNTNSYVVASMLTDGTFTALTNSATVAQFGKTINSTAHGLVSGQFIRIGGAGSTFPVFLVDVILDANNFTIKGGYPNASGVIANTSIGVITADTVIGLQLTGRPIIFNGIDLYQKTNFIASLYDTSTTGFNVLATPATTTPLFYGQGYWQQVRDQEYFAQGYFGITNRIQFPGSILQPATRAVVGNTYNSVVIEHFSEEETSLQRVVKKPLTTEIYFYSSTAPTLSTKQNNFLVTLSSLVEYYGVRVL